MRKLLDTVLAGVLAASTVTGATLSPPLAAALDASPAGTQRVIVMMKDAPGARSAIRSLNRNRSAVAEAMQRNASISQAALLEELGGNGFAESANVVSNWLTNSVVMDVTPEQIKALELREDVEAIELNETIQLEPFVASEVTPGKRAQGDDSASTWGIKATKALEARNTYGVDGSGVVVGILDTGFDGNHPLIADKIIGWKSFDGGNQSDPVDDNGHGTHCAGTIGGDAFNGMEIGVAPGVKYVAGKIFTGGGSATTEGIMGGMQWIVDPDGVANSGDEPRLVSNSWGGGPGRKVFLEATKAWVELGIAPIFAAGNSGPGSTTVGTPGGFLESYAVGATTVSDGIASFSSRGPSVWDGVEYIKPDISAPGKDVTSLKANKPNETWTISGTSMATPHVAGMAALLYQANPDLTIEQLFEAINSTSIEAGPAGKDNDFGHGRINAFDALSIVISGGKVAGHVLDSDGAAVTHAKLTVNETGTQIRIKADGTFKTTLPEGEYTLSVTAFGFVAAGTGTLTVTAGEEVHAHIVLDRAASGTVSGTLTGAGAPAQGTLVVLDTPLAAFESGADGAFSVTLPAGSYSLAGSAYGYEAGVSADFTVTADQDTTVSFDLSKLPPVLVVDDDDGKNYEGFYSAALGETAHKVMGYDQLASLMSGNFLGQYETVVWFTGADYSGSLTAADQASLGEYLDMGGRLFVSGQDIGYELKTKAFMADRLGASFVKDTAGAKAVEGDGFAAAIEGGDGANNQRYPDVIAAAGNGQVFLSYTDGTVAGVKTANGSSKVVYLSFGFEGIDTAANRSALMANVLGYLAPSAADMGTRIEAVAAKAPSSELEARDQAALGSALLNLVSTRFDAAALTGSADRNVRRQAAFEAMSN